uniref:Uncharacterized protein n=1 Tax=Timema genevievae TaxID=629358 RepID=A0A7R9PRZ1_TIMGE|nr:unnamed protein product [Timema genevievae]
MVYISGAVLQPIHCSNKLKSATTMYKLITFFALVAVASAAPGLIGAPAISHYAAPGLIGAPATYTATYGVAAPGHLAYAAAPASYGYAASPLAYAAAPASYGYAAAPVAYATGHRVAYSVAPVEQHGYKIAY